MECFQQTLCNKGYQYFQSKYRPLSRYFEESKLMKTGRSTSDKIVQQEWIRNLAFLFFLSSSPLQDNLLQ